MAINHGRKPEDVPKPDVDCEVHQSIICAKKKLAFVRNNIHERSQINLKLHVTFFIEKSK